MDRGEIMISKKKPTAAQQKWWDWLIQQGCYLGLGEPAIHHCVGSTAKHDKIHMGQDFVIPLSYLAHQGPHGIHMDRSLFAGHGLGESRKEIEKAIFSRLVAHYARQHHGELPMPADVYAAIMDYHK
jgi:hypothetical protein